MEYCHFVNVDPETKQERMHHITPDFPYGADLCDLHIFPGNMFPWHWHRELEVFYMRRGSLTYHLPCGAVTFSQGEGGFINSNILHKTTCAPEDACIQEEQQFSPEFVGGQQPAPAQVCAAHRILIGASLCKARPVHSGTSPTSGASVRVLPSV